MTTSGPSGSSASGVSLNPALVGGIAQLITAGAGSGFSAIAAGKARSHQERMYRNRYLWTVEDMRQAGLNPILAATGGQVGGAASAPMAQTPNMGSPPDFIREKENRSTRKGRQNLLNAQYSQATSASNLSHEQAASVHFKRPVELAQMEANASTARSMAAILKVEADWLRTPEGKAWRKWQHKLAIPQGVPQMMQTLMPK